MTVAIPTPTAAAVKLHDDIAWCRALADSNILPRQFQGKPANLLFAVELADSLGLSRITALTGIHVVDGKPSASADLIAGLIRRQGHKLRVIVNTEEMWAEAVIIRHDDPDFEYKARWDKAKAVKAGLWSKKGPWQNYPDQMLRSRAITEVARMGASDALHGVSYTPEELGATIDENGDVIYDANPNPRPVAHSEAPQQQRSRPQAQQGGMAGLAQNIGAQQQPVDPEALFNSFVEAVGKAETREALLALHAAAAEKLPAEYVEAGQKLCIDTAAARGVAQQTATATTAAPAAADQEPQDAEVVDEAPAAAEPTHEQAVGAVQEALGAQPAS